MGEERMKKYMRREGQEVEKGSKSDKWQIKRNDSNCCFVLKWNYVFVKLEELNTLKGIILFSLLVLAYIPPLQTPCQEGLSGGGGPFD